MKKRVAVILDLKVIKPISKAELEKLIKETFPHEEMFRINFYSIDHKEQEIVNSLKSQSVECPIDVIFHETCISSDKSRLMGILGKNLSKFKLHFHHPRDKFQIDAIKKTIEANYAALLKWKAGKTQKSGLKKAA